MIECYQQALTIYQEISNRSAVTNSLFHLGKIYELLRQYQQAIECYQQALTIYQEIRDRSAVANTLSRLGKIYEFLEQHQQAIECYQQALTIIPGNKQSLSCCQYPLPSGQNL